MDARTDAAPGRRLPHAFPFLLIDRVVTHDPGTLCVAEALVTADATLGPRPGPVPRMLLVEMLCQAAGLAAPGAPTAVTAEASPSTSARPAWLAALREVRFHREALPGERVTLTVRRVGGFGGVQRFHAEASVAGEILADGELTLGGR